MASDADGESLEERERGASGKRLHSLVPEEQGLAARSFQGVVTTTLFAAAWTRYEAWLIVGAAIVYLQLDLQPKLLAFAISGWGVPLALWGALLVDAKPSGRDKALRGFRDLSYASACLMTVFAILPACVRWLPEPLSIIVAWVVPAAFFLGLAARNRRASEEDQISQATAGTMRTVRPPRPWPR